MIDVWYVTRFNDDQFFFHVLNPYEAQARAIAYTISRGIMHLVEPGKVHAAFAQKQANYGPFRFGEAYA